MVVGFRPYPAFQKRVLYRHPELRLRWGSYVPCALLLQIPPAQGMQTTWVTPLGREGHGISACISSGRGCTQSAVSRSTILYMSSLRVIKAKPSVYQGLWVESKYSTLQKVEMIYALFSDFLRFGVGGPACSTFSGFCTSSQSF